MKKLKDMNWKKASNDAMGVAALGTMVAVFFHQIDLEQQQEARDYTTIDQDSLLPFNPLGLFDRETEVSIVIDNDKPYFSYEYFSSGNDYLGLDKSQAIVSIPQSIYDDDKMMEDVTKWINGEGISLDSYFSLAGLNHAPLSQLSAQDRQQITVLPTSKEGRGFMRENPSVGPSALANEMKVYLPFERENYDRKLGDYFANYGTEFIAWHEIFHVLQINENPNMGRIEKEARADVASIEIMQQLYPDYDFDRALVGWRAEDYLMPMAQRFVLGVPRHEEHANLLAIAAVKNGEDVLPDDIIYDVNDVARKCIRDEMEWYLPGNADQFATAAQTALKNKCTGNNSDATRIVQMIAALG